MSTKNWLKVIAVSVVVIALSGTRSIWCHAEVFWRIGGYLIFGSILLGLLSYVVVCLGFIFMPLGTFVGSLLGKRW